MVGREVGDIIPVLIFLAVALLGVFITKSGNQTGEKRTFDRRETVQKRQSRQRYSGNPARNRRR